MCKGRDGEITFHRIWAMPSADTFDMKPIGAFVKRFLANSSSSVDPFSRNKRWCTYTNDLNPKTQAEYHMDAEDFLKFLTEKGAKCDLAILDPPYSQFQVSQCYAEAGLKGQKDTRNAAMYARVRTALVPILTEDAIVLSFGWNSCGMGKKHGFEIFEILLVPCGGAHNDIICIAERRKSR